MNGVRSDALLDGGRRLSRATTLIRRMRSKAAWARARNFKAPFGYYAHGVGPETGVGRLGKAARRSRDSCSRGAIRGHHRSLAIHDLVLSTCAAGRERDWQFAQDA
jgi:hypothetical protein